MEKKEPPKSTLTVKAVRNGQPLQARYELFKTDEETAKQGEKIGAGVTEKGGTMLTLPPNTYNLVVENTEDTLKPTVTFEGVVLGLGENVEKIAEFSGGTLIVKALRNGVSVNASCSIYKAGGDQEKGKERITGGSTDGKGKEFKLAPGSYEVTVEDLEDANRPSLAFQNVVIEAGKTVEKVAEFSGGALIVKALKNGKPFHAFCLVYKTNEDEDKEKEKAAEARIELEGTQFKFTPGAYDVVVVNQDDATRATYTFDNVTEAAFSRNGALCAFVTLKKDTTDSTTVQLFDTRMLQSKRLFSGKGLARKILADDAGRQVAWLFTHDTAKVKRYNLNLWTEKQATSSRVADTLTVGLPRNWEVSENGKMNFSEDGGKLYFGTAPKILSQPKDTLLDEEKAKIDLWNWQDGRLQSQQLKELESDQKQSYLAVYRIGEKRFVQLADTLNTRVKTIRKGNAEMAIGFAEKPYEILSSWEEANYRELGVYR